MEGSTWARQTFNFLLTQYKKAPVLQRVFIWTQVIAGSVLIVFSLAQDVSMSDFLNEWGLVEVLYQENTNRVLQGRNVIFGVAFAIFGITAILYENIYELIVGMVMTIVFEIIAIVEFASDVKSQSSPHAKTGSTPSPTGSDGNTALQQNSIFHIAIGVFAVSTLVTILNVGFVAAIVRTLGRNSSLLFYSAGSNAQHRAAYSVFLKFAAVLKMDVFIQVNFYINVLYFLFGAGDTVALCDPFSSQCLSADGGDASPLGRCIDISDPTQFRDPTVGCYFSSSTIGQIALTVGLMVSLAWSWFCLMSIRMERKVMAIILLFLGLGAPVLGCYSMYRRSLLCCDFPFAASLIGLLVTRFAFIVSMIRCILQFDKGLLEVFARRERLGRTTPATVELRISTSEFTDENGSAIGSSRGGAPAATTAKTANKHGVQMELSMNEQVTDQSTPMEAAGVDVVALMEDNGFSVLDTASAMDCGKCGKPIAAGSTGWWKRGVGVLHTDCAVAHVNKK